MKLLPRSTPAQADDHTADDALGTLQATPGGPGSADDGVTVESPTSPARSFRWPAPRAVGVHLASDAIRACEIRRQGSTITASIPLDPGVIVDGEIRDQDACVAALRELWADGGFTTRRVVLGVNNQDVVTRQIDVPVLGDRDLRLALAFELDSIIPFPPGESELDFLRIETIRRPQHAPTDRILAIAALRSMTRSVVATTRAAGLRPIALDLVPLALVRAVNSDVEEDTHAIVQLGTDSLTIAVHHHDRVRFTRTVMTPSTASSLSGEIEHQLTEFGELWDTSAGGNSQRRSTSDNPSVRAIEGTLEYYDSQEGARAIERLTIVGDLRVASTLVAALHGELQVPISLANPLFDRPITDPELAEAAAPTAPFVTAYGLALRPDASTAPARPRLLPAPENPDDPRDLLRIGVSSFAAAALIAAGATALLGPDASEDLAARDAAAAVNADMATALEEVTDAVDLAAERDELADIAQDVREDQVLWTRLVRDIEAVAPPGASLLAVRSDTLDDDEEPGNGDDEPAAVGTMEITGQSVGQSTIGAWLSALEDVPGIRDPWLSNAATTQDVNGSEFTNFSITMTIDETVTAGGDPAASAADQDEEPS